MIIGWAVLIVKMITWLAVIFYAPLIAQKLGEFCDNKKGVVTIVYFGTVFWITIAVFWNIQDFPLHAWSSLRH